MTFVRFLCARLVCRFHGHIEPRTYSKQEPGKIDLRRVCRRCHAPLGEASYQGQYPLRRDGERSRLGVDKRRRS